MLLHLVQYLVHKILLNILTEEEEMGIKKLAVILSQITAKYHLQTAITPFAIITYFTQRSPSIAISWYFIYVKVRTQKLINGNQIILDGITH